MFDKSCLSAHGKSILSRVAGYSRSRHFFWKMIAELFIDIFFTYYLFSLQSEHWLQEIHNLQ